VPKSLCDFGKNLRVYGDEFAELHVTHAILNNMVGVGNVQVGENGVEYVHNASNRSHGHLLAGCTCNDQLPRGKQKRSCF